MIFLNIFEDIVVISAGDLYAIASAIFLNGMLGFLESVNFLNVLISSEIIMLGGNFHFLTSAVLLGSTEGQAFVLNFLSTTASETVLGLSLLILVYRTKGSTSVETNLGLRG